MKMPILTKGEKMAEIVSKNSNFPMSDKFPRSFETAREEIKANLKEIRKNIIEMNEDIEEEFVVTVRMFKDYIAKSYIPEQLEDRSNTKIVGARNFTTQANEQSKLYFLKTNLEGVKKLENKLDSNNLTKEFEKTIMRIEKIDFLTINERVLGFEDEWEEGNVEIVLHPIENGNKIFIEKVKKILGKNISIKEYKNGPTFISIKLNLKELKYLSNFNLIRTIHPLRNFKLDVIRNKKYDCILKRKFEYKMPLVKIGIFDGGINKDIDLFSGLVEELDCVEEEKDEEGIYHGTIVSGAALYGSLNLNENEITKCPTIGVEHFRVFPIKNLDYDLYEIIDIIEKVVPKNKDIKIYNISFGPPGPILDDSISRFTYALDKLAYEEDVLFVVAVGNDGENILNRIQAPADLVNGLGIGAYTYEGRNLSRAKYSCIGNGREGAKMKPDLLAFGGCNNHPFYGISSSNAGVELVAGTSFAAPIVSGLAGKMLSISEELTPQTIKSLLILNSSGQVNKENGFGFIEKTEEDLLNCSEKEVTILYNGKIKPTTNIKLDIPFPKINYRGIVNIDYVLSMATSVNPVDTDGYTASCIEDTFYPHKDKYIFSKKAEDNDRIIKKTINIEKEKEKVDLLINEGYKRSNYPATKSNSIYKTEQERRLEFKWDTVVKRQFSLKSNSIDKPFIILHGMERGGFDKNHIVYALAVKITLKNYSGNLYQDIRTQYSNLLPLKTREQITTKARV
jgi:subtilisin family serine protease